MTTKCRFDCPLCPATLHSSAHQDVFTFEGVTSSRFTYVDHSTEVYHIVATRRAALELFPLA